jgi:hypothetical protein
MLSPIIVFASASIGGFALRTNMVEDFDEIGSWPGRGDWRGWAEHTRPTR